MAEEQVLVYGVSERGQAATQLELQIEELKLSGFTILPKVFDRSAALELSKDLDRQMAETPSEFKQDKNVIRCPLGSSEAFLKVATCGPLMSVCTQLFGENYVLLQQNGIVNSPNEPHYQSRWHRDLAYQHFVVSEPLAINALLCIDEFNLQTGGTHVLPGSHLMKAFPSDQYVKKHEICVSANVGDIILMDAMLYHRAGKNISAGVRRGVNHLIGRPLLVQQIDIPTLLAGKHSQDPFLNKYLGYRWNPAKSVDAWRKTRM